MITEDNPLLSSVRYDGNITNVFFGDKDSPFSARFLRFDPSQMSSGVRVNFQTTRLSGPISGHSIGIAESLNDNVISYERIFDEQSPYPEDKEQNRLTFWKQADTNKPMQYIDSLYVDTLCEAATDSITSHDKFIFTCQNNKLMSITITDQTTAKQLESDDKCNAQSLRNGQSAVYCITELSKPINQLQKDKSGELLVGIQDNQPVIIDNKTLTIKPVTNWADNYPAIAIKYNPQGNILYVLDAIGQLHRFDRHNDHFHQHGNALFVEQFNIAGTDYFDDSFDISQPQLTVVEDGTAFIFEPVSSHIHAISPADFDNEKFEYSVPLIFDSSGINFLPSYLTILKDNLMVIASKEGEFAVVDGNKIKKRAQMATQEIIEHGEGGHHHHHGHDHGHEHGGDGHSHNDGLEHNHNEHEQNTGYVLNYFSLPNNQKIIGLSPSSDQQTALIFSPDGIRFINMGSE